MSRAHPRRASAFVGGRRVRRRRGPPLPERARRRVARPSGTWARDGCASSACTSTTPRCGCPASRGRAGAPVRARDPLRHEHQGPRPHRAQPRGDARLGHTDAAKLRRWEREMDRVFPDIKAGDRLVGVSLPGKEARFYSQDRFLGAVADPEFAQRLLRHLARPGHDRAEAARADAAARALGVAAAGRVARAARRLRRPGAAARDGGAADLRPRARSSTPTRSGSRSRASAAMLLAARILDAVQDPLLGWWSDRRALARRQPLGLRRRRRAAARPRACSGSSIRPSTGPARSAWWLIVNLVVVYTAFSLVTVSYQALRRGDLRRPRRAHARDGVARGLRADRRLPRRGAARDPQGVDGRARGLRAASRSIFVPLAIVAAARDDPRVAAGARASAAPVDPRDLRRARRAVSQRALPAPARWSSC